MFFLLRLRDRLRSKVFHYDHQEYEKEAEQDIPNGTQAETLRRLPNLG